MMAGEIVGRYRATKALQMGRQLLRRLARIKPVPSFRSDALEGLRQSGLAKALPCGQGLTIAKEDGATAFVLRQSVGISGDGVGKFGRNDEPFFGDSDSELPQRCPIQLPEALVELPEGIHQARDGDRKSAVGGHRPQTSSAQIGGRKIFGGASTAVESEGSLLFRQPS